MAASLLFGLATARAANVVPGRAASLHEQAPQTSGQSMSGRQGGPPPASGTLGGGWDWWSDPVVKKELKLTDDQVRRINDIFERREAEVKPVWYQLNREGDKLDKMTRERLADDATYAVQVSQVQHLFSEIRKSRTVMMYRMYRELQPEQYKKLQEIMERRRPSNDGRGPGPR